MKLYKIIDAIIYALGTVFLATIAHELYHYSVCGGQFIAGIYYINQKFGAGVTYCVRPVTGELIPYLITFTIVGSLIYVKRKLIDTK